MKTAILQVADSGPLESLIVMLRSVGYTCLTPSEALKKELREVCKCDTVLDIAGLVKGLGYDPPLTLREASVGDMDTCALYVDIKAQRNAVKVWKRWPRLKERTLWYRINGGQPEHVIKKCKTCEGDKVMRRGDKIVECWTCKGIGGEDCGDEVNLPCPILTPNMWYREKRLPIPSTREWFNYECVTQEVPWKDRSYACYPPFYRFNDYSRCGDNLLSDTPVCLIHGIGGWGYSALIPPLRGLGARCYGEGSPDGLIRHQAVPPLLHRALCMVHLKSNDAPGYAIYESLAASCPLICSRRLIWRCRMQDLLIPGKTCLVFDRETHAGLTEQDVVDCTVEIKRHLTALRDPVYNRQIGQAGHDRLKEVMWDKERDGPSFTEFMSRCFPD